MARAPALASGAISCSCWPMYNHEMLVRLFGVSVKVAPTMTVSDLFEQLNSGQGQLSNFRGFDRLYHVDKVGDYHTALFLTARDHRVLLTMRDNGGILEVTRQEIEAGTHLVDF